MTKSHVAAIRNWPLFSLLDAAWLEQWARRGSERQLGVGEVLIHEGVATRRLYLVVKGKVRISRQGEDGHERSLGLCGPGELIGDYGLLSPGLMTATCRAAEPTTVVTFSVRRLMDEIRVRPDLSSSLRAWIRFHFALRYLRQQVYLGFLSAPLFLLPADAIQNYEFAPGMTIQGNGLADDCCFIIREGTVELGDAGNRRAAGECFGAEALLGAVPLSARALDAVRCWGLRRDQFLERYFDGSGDQQSIHSRVKVASTAFSCVRQQQTADCGVAALTTALRFHVSEVEESRVRSLVPLGHGGANLASLARAAESLGFGTHAVRICAEQLPSVRCPAIAHLADDHYVVLCDTIDRVTIADPACGVRELSRSDFAASWSGALLLVLPPRGGDGQSAASILANNW